MSAIRKVAVAGATGLVGPAILTSLLENEIFEVTVLSRQDSTSTSLEGVAVKKVDYGSVNSLTDALRGYDAVISALGYHAISTQKVLLEAAIHSGIKRFIASEYGNDTRLLDLEDFPIYEPKAEIRTLLDESSRRNANFTYSSIMTASFLAPGYPLRFLIDTKNRHCIIKDRGDVLFTACTYEAIGQAALGILTHLEATRNRPVRISSSSMTQNQLLAAAQRVNPGLWTIEETTIDRMWKTAMSSWAAGDRSEPVVNSFIWRAFLGPEGAGLFMENDNDLLGIQTIDESALEAIIQSDLAID